MTTVQEVIQAIESLAPCHLAESWDNPGFMVGHRDQEVSGIVTTLDVTPEAVQYAISNHCNLIVSHHPMIFKGIKSLDLARPQGAMMETLIKNDMAVYSAHTNLDIADGGLNDMLAARIGLIELRGLAPTSKDTMYKLVVFVPESHADVVRDAMGNMGAGFIGQYSHCSYSVSGQGRFVPQEGSNPFIGQQGEMEVVGEERIEILVPAGLLPKVIATMLEVHPYEEVAYDVYELYHPNRQYSLGRIGILPDAMTLEEFRQHLSTVLPHAHVRLAGAKVPTIKSVALCSGAGAEFMARAVTMGADAYVTGDVKYHDGQQAKELGLLVADCGHFGTEEIVAKGLQDYLLLVGQEKGWNFPIVANEIQEDFFF